MMLQHIKDGVIITGPLSINLLDALLTCQRIYILHGYPFVVTALSDGKHMDKSLHYRGYAADLRSRDIPPGDVPTLILEISKQVGPAFDIVQESDHIHIEYDPQHDGGHNLP